jgi:hypothetical protein
MKHLPALILGNAVLLLVLSCGSVDLSKKYPNMVANVDPFPVGSAEAQFDRFLSPKVNRIEIQVVFHPRLNAVSLEFRHDLLLYRQFWDQAARNQFAASLELYKKDFEERKLIDKFRKTRTVYGNVKGRLEWELFKYTKTRISNPTIDLGYRFKESTPFFSTFMRTAKEVPTEGESDPLVNSKQLYMYFTRAQADQLVMLFDQAYLIGLLREKTDDIIDRSAEADKEAYGTPRDNYNEYGE